MVVVNMERKKIEDELYVTKKAVLYENNKVLRLKNGKELLSPAIWVGVSVVESTDIQMEIFEDAGVENVLFNAYDLLFRDKDGKRLDFLYKLRDTKKFNIKVDSGGFQLMKNPNLKQDLNPLSVIQLQDKVGCDISVQLDLPLGIGTSRSEKFDQIDESVSNYKTAYEVLSNHEKTIVMPVIHGHDKNMLDYCIRELIAVNPRLYLVGLGSLVPMLKKVKGSSKVGTKWDFIKLLLYVREKLRNCYIHCFGVSGTMSYLAVQCGMDSYDSAGWIQKAAYGQIQLPGISDRYIEDYGNHRPFLKRMRKVNDGYVDEVDMWMKCDCPACKPFKVDNWTAQDNYNKRKAFVSNITQGRYLRALHNLSLFINENKLMQEAKKHHMLDMFCRDRLSNSRYLPMSEEITKYRLGLKNKLEENDNLLKNVCELEVD